MQNFIHLIANFRLAFANIYLTIGIRYNRYVITLPKFTYSSLVFQPEIAFNHTYGLYLFIACNCGTSINACYSSL